ncbi:MAG: MFS transporter [Cyclobacteriaceae bacterium]|nr:MFS transporter [Cyclobacteriaceae bacterium]
MKHNQETSFYGLQFWLLCASSFLFFASFNMLIPELPNYITSLGGEKYKGFIIAIFTLSAGLSRPFSGKLADTIGRMPVMIVGVVVCFLIGFLYPVLTSVSGFLLLRFFHGFSTGFKPTGTVAYLADIVPINRRGEAMGIIGMMGSFGMAAGPAVGSWIAESYGINMMFYTSSGVALLSILVLIGMKETLPNKQTMKFGLLKISMDDVYEPRVIKPSVVFLLTAISFGTILIIIPDYSEYLGVKNKGLFFAVFTISSIVIRVLGGRASDKYGREIVIKIAAIGLTLALLLLALSPTKTYFIVSAIIFGLSVGLNAPNIFAWAVDLSDEKHRGRAMSTVYIALEIGIGGGALLSSWLYANNSENFQQMFLVCSAFSFAAFLFLMFSNSKKQNV